MLQTITKHIKYGNVYGAVEHQSFDEKDLLALILLKKQKNEFHIESQNQYNSLDDLSKNITKEQHLYLIVNNNNVLSKTIGKELNENKAVQTAYPNLKISDFYYEITQLEESTYVAICRKDFIQHLIEAYKKHLINVIGFSLGNSSAAQLIPFIETSTFLSSNATITANNKQISSIQLLENNNTSTYTINGIQIQNNHILQLAGILAYYTNSIYSDTNFGNYISKLTTNFAQNRFFKTGLKTGIILLFIALLVNFLVYSHYTTVVTNLTEKATINQTYKEQLLLLNNEINTKKKLVDEMVNSSSSKTSQYFDIIGMLVPNTILLEALEYQPILKIVENDKPLTLDTKVILIKGTTTNGENFSAFITELEKQNWIHIVEIIDYGTGKSTSTGFELKVVLE